MKVAGSDQHTSIQKYIITLDKIFIEHTPELVARSQSQI